MKHENVAIKSGVHGKKTIYDKDVKNFMV